MKTFNYFSIVCAVLLIGVVSGCTEYPQYEVTSEIFVDKSSLNMYVGDEAQLLASPADITFKWTSDNEQIATVTQTGLVKAIGEGLATVSIEYGKYETKKVDVRSQIFIPLTGIRVPTDSTKLRLGESIRIWIYPIPENASEMPAATWRSENPEIVTVDQDGLLTGMSYGTTNVVVTIVKIDGNVLEKTIKVRVSSIIEIADKAALGWSIVQSYDDEPGAEASRLVDSDPTTGWHSRWSSGSSPLPHYIIIDMKERVTILNQITVVRASNGHTKTIQFRVGDDPNINASTWRVIAEGTFPDQKPYTITLDVVPATGRYLALYFPNSLNGNNTSITNFELYIEH